MPCLQTLQGELRAAKQELEARGTRLAKLEQQVAELQHAQQVAAESGARLSHELEAARSTMEQLTAANRKLTGDSERGAKAAVELVAAEAALHLERDERERLVAQHRSRLNKFSMQAGFGSVTVAFHRPCSGKIFSPLGESVQLLQGTESPAGD